MNANAKFSLALLQAAEVEGFPCIDKFLIKCDGAPALELHFDWATDDPNGGDVVGRVRPRPEESGMMPSDLPRIYNGFQLIGIVDAMLADRLDNSGCEFYSELFFDEQGGPLELPLDFDALTGTRLPDIDLDLNN